MSVLKQGSYWEKDRNKKTVDLELYKGLWIRPGSSDKSAVDEPYNDYGKHIKFKDKVVMDLGACIGGFSKRALKGKASKVVAYEPDELNFEILKHNVGDDCELINAAVTNSNDKTIQFNAAFSCNSTVSGSIVKSCNKKHLFEVSAVNFKSELERVKPDIIKMDVEGAEYLLLADELPSYVSDFLVEFHLTHSTNNERMEFVNKFARSDDWEIIHYDRNGYFWNSDQKFFCSSEVTAHFRRHFVTNEFFS